MDWNQAYEDNRRVLKSIVATLFALAILSEGLCDCSRPVRGFVLWILRGFEDVAWDFVMDTAEDCGALAQRPACIDIAALHGGDSPADAMRLAHYFRMLATLLDAVADLDVSPCSHRTRQPPWLGYGITMHSFERAANLFAIVRLMAGAPAHFHHATAQLTVERFDSS